MEKTRILILGGYGTFGKLIVKYLSKDPVFHILIAGRHENKAQDFALKMSEENPHSNVDPFVMDWQSQDFVQKLKMSNANIVVHAAGPFWGQDYSVVKACIELGIHYIDLSDDREFVVNITQFDEEAKKKNLVLISGASTVPGLSSVIIEKFAQKYAVLREIEMGIAPGNQIELGEATIATVLGSVGKPFQRLENGQWKKVYGLQNLHLHYYGDNLGLRWHGNSDIPDLILLPERYSTLRQVTFYLGLEVPFLHIMLWLMSWLARIKIVKNWASSRKSIIKINRWFSQYGAKDSGMYVCLRGANHRYQPLEVIWNLVAEKGDGAYIPIVSSVILVKKIAQKMITSGAYACMGMFTFEEFEDLIRAWRIYYTVEEIES